MLNIRTLEKIAEKHNLTVIIEKRELTNNDIDYHMNHRVYDVSSYDSSKFCFLLEELEEMKQYSFFIQDSFIGKILTFENDN